MFCYGDAYFNRQEHKWSASFTEQLSRPLCSFDIGLAPPKNHYGVCVRKVDVDNQELGGNPGHERPRHQRKKTETYEFPAHCYALGRQSGAQSTQD